MQKRKMILLLCDTKTLLCDETALLVAEGTAAVHVTGGQGCVCVCVCAG